MEFKHTSVLLNETTDGLNVKSGGIYIDATLGGGGHSERVLKKLNGSGVLVGLDRDTDALNASKERLREYKNIKFVHGNFHDIKQILNNEGLTGADGIMADLGVSSYQLDNKERGFSYMADAPLDMRMNRQDGLTAYDVVNTYSRQQLTHILYNYGEEKFSAKIAALIEQKREVCPIKTTFELVKIIESAIPERFRRIGSHPAKRTFQAIRIEVNGELEPLTKAIEDMFDSLNPGGRLCIISFHSLEDRIVKNAFLSFAKGCTCPPQFPVCICGNKPKGKIITRKPILPSDGECKLNKRSKSAKLRIIEKL